MGQKVHPKGFTVGFFRNWDSRWMVAKSDVRSAIREDYDIRTIIKKQAKGAGIARIEIERRGDEVTVFVSAARQGILIGKKGQEIDRLREILQKKCSGSIKIVLKEVANPDKVAQIIGEGIAEQLEKRMAFRRVMKKSMETTMAAEGVYGVKLQISGRLNGAEMARTEKMGLGQMPRQTMRADIDYGFAEALTTYGKIGIKVWVFKGLKEKKSLHLEDAVLASAQ